MSGHIHRPMTVQTICVPSCEEILLPQVLKSPSKVNLLRLLLVIAIHKLSKNLKQTGTWDIFENQMFQGSVLATTYYGADDSW